MEILQTVVIKQILTEASKQQLFDYFNREKMQLQNECDQLKFQLKKLELKRNISSPISFHSFEKEIKFREDKIKMVEFRIEQLHILPLGSEIKQSEHQGLIQIEVGDKWDPPQKTIIIKDGYVVEIR